MKKKLIVISMMIVLVTGCKKDTIADNTDQTEPTQPSAVTLPAEVTPPDSNADSEAEDSADGVSIIDYYPLQSDLEYVYEGEGNEYASYKRYIDFVDKENKRIQTRTNNGGTETIRVIEIKNGTLSVIETLNECYYRDDFLKDAVAGKEAEVLLMEPLKEGTQWKLPDGRKRYISDMDAQIETPAGSYKAIEVTTESAEDTTRDYYALGVGLVKSVFEAKGMEVFSSLSEINPDTPFTKMLEVYYPDADEKIYVETVSLTFHTNDITRKVMEETLKKRADKDTYLPLASDNTVVNSLYLGKDQIVYVDFSGEFVREMNAGAGYELLILQSITNTLAGYYQAKEVSITLDGNPYESGHILLEKGETFKVDMENVVRQ